MSSPKVDRRLFLQLGTVGCASLGMTELLAAPQDKRAGQEKSGNSDKPSRFQIACMTLPYAAFPLERALTGLQKAGYQFVAWGTNHKENGGKPVPVLAGDAAPDKAKELGQ